MVWRLVCKTRLVPFNPPIGFIIREVNAFSSQFSDEVTGAKAYVALRVLRK